MLNFMYSLCVICVLNFKYVHCLIAPTIFLPDQGVIVGTYLKMFRTQNIVAYLGVPYAQAARFSPPEIQINNKKNVKNASHFGPDCWQKPQSTSDVNNQKLFKLITANFNGEDSPNGYDENCLLLNIYIPDGSIGTKSYSVIVWLHGGDFSYGSPTDINPFQLVLKQKVIVVTVSYRLNIFGFLSSGDGELQGNYGLMDQSAALFWIKRNIPFFGGNEREITLMGHSAGGISVGLHLISGEWSKDSFSKAIIMSGNPLSEGSIKTPKEYQNILNSIANIFGCPRRPVSMLVHCLKRVDPKIILDNLPPYEWGPVLDYGLSNTTFPFISEYPITMFRKGNFLKVPVLIGITDMEDVLYTMDNVKHDEVTHEDFSIYLEKVALSDVKTIIQNETICSNIDNVLNSLNYVYRSQQIMENEIPFKKIVQFNTDRIYFAPLLLLADILGQFNKNYVYIFNATPKTPFHTLPPWITAPKYFDQLYIWGIPYMNNSNLVKEWSPQDKKLSEVVMTMWANFAKFSNPTFANVYVEWHPYSQETKRILMINETFQESTFKQNYIVNFWNDYYPKVLKFTAECCNVTNGSASKNSIILMFIAWTVLCINLLYKKLLQERL